MEKLFVATSNAHKLEEIREILKLYGIERELVCPASFDDHDEPIEDGKSFKDNALIKARYWFNKYHLPTIADDSGLTIHFFNEFPGIYSARFMQNYSYFEKNSWILKGMKNESDREAKFHCVIAYINENTEECFEGILQGEIADSIKGEHGFGYDPIFFLPELNKTTSELSPEEKNRLSHRSLALRKWAEYVKAE
ncbi:MAG: RdgB/HAM1 family non-canonical purine NTP pyrophosphatase [Solobacterium sp.]|nr:RdgB/HAM1 family non-canonical purine NTP pyrophosphatase [Erysipelotrichaceae bacterium]MCI6701324.1 RdgB/HAM1 family non-canonical purine NTP pyrophosphatase [Solobacterium sp.]MDD6122360.1 RdgB/HAM1 family non-canonical purine NTP pyrophosphatase [Solobacterium sp.]MDD6498394.1 RdgB/HAM1 family non-canonical purine NTP pyrophosphatase [Solobacterium sp.]MDD6834442.1 RdgB/HAM1 family non-canonical purine NTP pyrophosphatase [Solobacterium sp.]